MTHETRAPRQFGVSEFKRRCLELLARVHRENKELVITKRGRPMARVVPIDADSQPLKGMLRDKLEIVGDIVSIDWSEDWEALR